MTLALDGSISSFGNIPNASSITSSSALTTANAGDLIIAIVCGQDQTSPWAVTSVTSASLTWNLWKRWQYVGGPSGNYQTIEVWYAWAAGTISESITAHFSKGVTDSTAHFFGVRGVDATYPFDETANIPVFNSDLSGSASLPSVSGVSTRETDTMMVVCWSEAGTVGAMPAVPSGYTQIRAPSTTYYDKNYSQSAYHVYAAAQSSISISFQTNSIANWGMAAFALVASGEGLAPAIETDLGAALADDASLGAVLTVVAPIELTATFIDDASLGATLRIIGSVNLTAAFIDDASLGAALMVATVCELMADLVDDAALTAAATIEFVYPPPIQVVVILGT